MVRGTGWLFDRKLSSAEVSQVMYTNLLSGRLAGKASRDEEIEVRTTPMEPRQASRNKVRS
jgi:hypothetical protein